MSTPSPSLAQRRVVSILAAQMDRCVQENVFGRRWPYDKLALLVDGPPRCWVAAVGWPEPRQEDEP